MKRAAIPLLAAIVFSTLLLGQPATPVPQLSVLPGSVVRGERLLTTNGCINCHTLNGKGGSRGPDLAAFSKGAASPELFAASLWNHMPRMMAAIEASKTPPPQLKPNDAADLFAYFYSTLYFSPSGNVDRGNRLFTEKQCATCHGEILNTERGRSILETWMDLNDPTAWAERMWNHAAAMDSAMSNRGISWPILSDRDIVDLVTFLSTRAGSRPAYALSIGEPELGQTVFERSCASCHSLGRKEKYKVDLLVRNAPTSVTGYIAAMWNHAPEMRQKGGSIPKLASGQMPDLIAYLFSQRYFFEPGEPERGKGIYESKGCASCHDLRPKETGAPDLTKTIQAYSPILLTAVGWSHGASMMKAMKQQRIDWPEFKKGEMAHLIAYMNSRLIVQIAAPR